MIWVSWHDVKILQDAKRQESETTEFVAQKTRMAEANTDCWHYDCVGNDDDGAWLLSVVSTLMVYSWFNFNDWKCLIAKV